MGNNNNADDRILSPESVTALINAQVDLLNAVSVVNQNNLKTLEVKMIALPIAQHMVSELGQRIGKRITEVINQEFAEELKTQGEAVQKELMQLPTSMLGVQIKMKVGNISSADINSAEARKVFDAAIKYSEVASKSGNEIVQFTINQALKLKSDQDQDIPADLSAIAYLFQETKD